MSYYYIKNLRDSSVSITEDISKQKPKVVSFDTKQKFRAWCSDSDTDHCFYSMVEGDTPRLRVSNDNPARKVYGVVADYDAPVDWDKLDRTLISKCGKYMPTWVSKTESNYVRLVWEFESPLPITMDMYDPFMKVMRTVLKLDRLLAGFDATSLKANQYFELGSSWRKIGSPLLKPTFQSALVKSASEKPPTTSEVCIPLEVVAKEVEKRFPNRWVSEFDVGTRGPLFWIDDGVNRDGCQVVEDGMVCYSDRAGKGFVSWREIFGGSFVTDYEEAKMGNLLDEYWYNGKMFYKILFGQAMPIQRDQLILELRQSGFSTAKRKGQTLSEVESALLTISNQNRINEIAPVLFSKERVVSYNSQRVLNISNIEPVEPTSDEGDPKHWPFLHEWLHQLFENSADVTAVNYFFAWMKRFYMAITTPELLQGQALLLVGPTGRGKSLLSNKVISSLVGGFSDASEFLTGKTTFNKDLARVAAWVVDDTTSAASHQDQLKATELIKRAVANPRLEYQAKYADSLTVPWTGRVIMSLNMDANSLSVIPALDSSNRDKIMALRISDSSRTKFPANQVLEATIEKELPHFARWLLDWTPPEEVVEIGRFGVKSFIDDTVADAAYDNSSRSSIAELVDYFAKKYRSYQDPASPSRWRGTLTDFLIAVSGFNEGRQVGRSGNMEFVRRGMASMEEAHKSNDALRPVSSEGHGGGKIWVIDTDPKYDIDQLGHIT